VGPENPKNIPSSELWAVTGRWMVTPDSRPAAAVIFWHADIAVVVHSGSSGSLPVPTLHADRDPRTPAPACRLPADGRTSACPTCRSDPLGVALPTVRNQVLFVFLLLAHDRRRVLHFNVTANPTAAWTAQQIVEAFPWQEPPKYLLRDRDKIYGQACKKRVSAVGFEEALTGARFPRRNPLRREADRGDPTRLSRSRDRGQRATSQADPR
jgi:hypothetical protein